MLTTSMKSFNNVVIFARKSSSISLSVTGTWLIGITISAATACGLSIGNKVTFGIVMQK